MLRSTLCLGALAVASGFLPATHTIGSRAVAPASSLRAAEPVVMGRKGRPAMPSTGQQGMGMQGQQQGGMPSAPVDGTSVFYLYCRSGPGKPWYPVSAMKGDGQTKGLIGAWLNSPVGKGVFKDQLDAGLANSIYDSERRLASMAVEQYRQLRDYQTRLQWGFKILDADVMAAEASGKIDKQKIVAVNKSMLEGQGLAQKAGAAASKLGDTIKEGKLGEALKDVKIPENPFDGLKLPKSPWSK